MAVPRALRPIACVAALNALVQGLIGILVNILALCVAFCAFGAAAQPTGDDFSQYLTYYLQGGECGGSTNTLYSGVTGPTALRVWFVLSLFFSLSMFVSSITLLVGVQKKWSDEKFQITLVSWLFINLFAEVDDVVLGYVFVNDFLTALTNTSQQDNVGPLTLGIVAFFSVRGLYLWLFNLCFIFYLFIGARTLHKYLNEQIPNLDQQPIESWPTLDDFGKSKEIQVSRSPTAVNTAVADRLETGQTQRNLERPIDTRWPSVNGQAQAVRVPWPDPPQESRIPKEYRERRTRSKREREVPVRRQDGVDNPAYEAENRYYVRLQNETGSSQDYEDPPPPRRGRERGGSQQWEPPKDHSRARREVREGAALGQYKQRATDPWREKPPPPPDYMEENGVPIPPVDYLDPQQEGPRSPSPTGNTRTLSLQQAILDKSLRLKKVPEELKRGFQK